MNKNNWLRHFLRLLLSAAVIALIAAFLYKNKSISFEAILHSLEKFGPVCVVVVSLCTLAQILFMILRNWFLFPREANLSLFNVAHAFSYGQLVNTFVPARAGEVVKAVIAHRDSKDQSLSLMTCAGVLLADRVVDIAAMVLLLLVSGAFLLPQMHARAAITPWSVSIGAAVVLILAGVVFWVRREGLAAKFPWLEHLQQGFNSLVRPKRLLLAVFVGTIAWSSEVIALLTLCHFQGISLTFTQGVFLLFVLNVAISVPISLANLGTFEAGLVFGLSSFGVAASQGIAIATVHHSLQIAGIVAWAGAIAIKKRIHKKPAPANDGASGEKRQNTSPASAS